MDFGENEEGECANGDHMVMGEINSAQAQLEDIPLNYLPCRNAVWFYLLFIYSEEQARQKLCACVME